MTDLPEGKIVAVPPDRDPTVEQALEKFGIPVIVSPYVQSGTMVVFDMDALLGKTPLPARISDAAELLTRRMRELAADGKLPGASITGIDMEDRG